MPLPPALAAKLAKRGLITARPKPFTKEQKKDFKGTSGCPNKYNIYHTCNYWCDTHWKGVLTPHHKYLRRMQKMLYKYPLPHNWMEVFDKGLGRYYYWDMETDLVSWLPPKHPRAVHTESAARLREKLAANEEEARANAAEEENDDHRKRHHKHGDRDRDRKDSRRHRHEDKERRKKSRKDDHHLDPMDPAAYSDIPQGTWSDGLDNKSRADSTASGVLYQQRPYPAPGEVLASNKHKSKKNVNFGNISYSSI